MTGSRSDVTLKRASSYGSTRIPRIQKAREVVALFKMFTKSALSGESFDELFADIAEYDEILERYRGLSLRSARVFEIGFGQRPDRLISLMNLTADARGVDTDSPLLNGTPREFTAILRVNGFERFVRSLVRHFLFDAVHLRRLKRALAQRGVVLKIEPDRLLTHDACKLTLPEKSLDLIISEDVFEHLPRESIDELVKRMALWLKPDGLALIRPNIFTGIRGGHLAEWFTVEEGKQRRSEPWEHLRKRRFPSRVYLNELTRADFRGKFVTSFKILEERVKIPDLGKTYLKGAAALDLKDFPEEELFSNQVLFVLQPRAA